MKRIIATFVLVALLACEADRVWERPDRVLFDDPADRWCGSCLTCDLADLPPFTTDPERFDLMRAGMYAEIDSVNAEAGEIVAAIRFFSVCLTADGLAMVGIVRFKDGHTHTWVDHTVVNPIDSTVTGIGG